MVRQCSLTTPLFSISRLLPIINCCRVAAIASIVGSVGAHVPCKLPGHTHAPAPPPALTQPQQRPHTHQHRSAPPGIPLQHRRLTQQLRRARQLDRPRHGHLHGAQPHDTWRPRALVAVRPLPAPPLPYPPPIPKQQLSNVLLTE